MKNYGQHAQDGAFHTPVAAMAATTICSCTFLLNGSRMKGLSVVKSRLRAFDFQVDDDGLLPSAHDDCLHGLVGPRVNLLVRYERRHVDEISGPGLVDKLQPFAPAKTCTALNDVQNRLEFSVVVRPRFHVRLHDHRSSPKLVGAGGSARYRSRSRHARSLESVR